LILFAACHNKGDLKRIAELEKENGELKEKLSPERINIIWESIQNKIFDSLIIGNDYSKGCWLQSYFIAFNTPISKSIKLNNEIYRTDIHFAQSFDNNFDTIYFSNPTKDRILVDYDKDYKLLKKSEKNFSYLPKDTGWYYNHIMVPIRNKRTGMVKLYPITDSFYVYK